MSAESESPVAAVLHELQSLRQHWWCFLLLGMAMVILGTICIVDPLLPSVASVVVLGFVLMSGGIAQIISSVWAGKWSGMLLSTMIGVLYVVVGYMIVDAPVVNMVIITKFIAIFLIVSGVFRIVSSLALRFPGWGWALINGGVTLLLGIIINRQLPEAALWVIGLFVGLEMLFNGWAWVMLSLGLRAVNKALANAAAE